MKKNDTIDAYIKRSPKASQAALKKIRQIILKTVPGAEETISYGIPTFKLDGRYVIYMAGYARHVSVHPALGGTGAALEKQLAKYRSGRGTLRFSLDEKIPYGLIEKFARARKKQHLERMKK